MALLGLRSVCSGNRVDRDFLDSPEDLTPDDDFREFISVHITETNLESIGRVESEGSEAGFGGAGECIVDRDDAAHGAGAANDHLDRTIAVEVSGGDAADGGTGGTGIELTNLVTIEPAEDFD